MYVDALQQRTKYKNQTTAAKTYLVISVVHVSSSQLWSILATRVEYCTSTQSTAVGSWVIMVGVVLNVSIAGFRHTQQHCVKICSHPQSFKWDSSRHSGVPTQRCQARKCRAAETAMTFVAQHNLVRPQANGMRARNHWFTIWFNACSCRTSMQIYCL